MTKTKINYDHIVIGKNYSALIAALKILSAKKNVLVVHDQLSTYFNSKNYFFSDFEKVYFIDLCKSVLSIEIDLETHFHPCEIKIVSTDQSWLWPVGTPSERRRELFRKFPLLHQLTTEQIDEQRFDLELLKISHDLVTHLNNPKKKKNADYLFDGYSLPQDFQNLVDAFYKAYERDEHFRGFTECLEYFFFNSAFFPVSRSRFTLVLLNLLLPYYKLDHGFEASLIHEFKEKGGEFRDGNILDWQINNRAHSILIEHYDGLFQANEIHLFGDFKPEKSFQISSQTQILQAKRFTYKKHFPWPTAILFNLGQGEIAQFVYLYSESKSNKFYIEMAMKNEIGEKQEFMQQKIDACLAHIFKLLNFEFENYESCETLPSAYTRSYLYSGKSFFIDKLNQNPELILESYIAPQEKLDLSSLDYWGDLRSRKLGILSYLLELRES